MSELNQSVLDLLHDPTRNQSTAFSEQQRKEHGLIGLLPPRVETLKEQVDHCLLQVSKKPNDLEQYIYLARTLSQDRV
jgi:hypothetical protein